MKSTLRGRFRYWLENFMARGGVSIFISLLVLFIIALMITTILRTITLALNPEEDIVKDFFNHFWIVFLGLTDPGTLGMEEGDFIGYKIVGIITILSGLVIFSMLIAFITTQMENMIYNFRKGRSQVIESGHTLVLGWNERVFDIIKELIIANESEKLTRIVILAEEDKEIMDDTVTKKIPYKKHVSIITRTGDTSSLNELKRVNVGEVKSAIILSRCPDSSSAHDKEISDTKVIKTILAMLGCQKNRSNLTIVAEIFSDEKRNLIDSLGFHNVFSINSWEILGKLLVQTSLSSGLELVYAELLSFEGCEIYTHADQWDNIPFGELPSHFPDGIPIGIKKKNNKIILRPAIDTPVENGDAIYILAEDDSTITFKKHQYAHFREIPYNLTYAVKKTEKELILGWHSIAEIVIREYAAYLPAGSGIDIVIHNPSKTSKNNIEKLKNEITSLHISLIDTNPLSRSNLKALNPFSYNNLIILAQDEKDYTPEKVDSETMLILLLLRDIIGEEKADMKRTKIITQVLNSENQELIEQSNVDDFIISNKMITKIIAQISENPNIKSLYDQIFSEEGSEIYLKPVTYYFDSFPVELSFIDIIHVVQKRDEICIGFRRGDFCRDSEQNFGVILNPPKTDIVTIKESDYFIVFAENEL